MDTKLTFFENYNIRRIFDEETETWLFSIVDIIQALIQQSDFQLGRNYWKVLKNRLKKAESIKLDAHRNRACGLACLTNPYLSLV